MDYEMVHNCQVAELNKFYLDYFGYRTAGLFVEVGAYDGYNFSNTYGLAKAGWKGIYVEPIPEHIRLCKETHKNHNVEVIPVAVGDHTGTVEMQIAGTVSTYSDFYIKSDMWKNEYKNNVITVQLQTLDDLLITRIIPDEFDLLVIDTEGSELEVLKGFSLDYWKPRAVIIEAHEASPFVELRKLAPEIDEYFSKDYRKVYAGEVNSIYVLRRG